MTIQAFLFAFAFIIILIFKIVVRGERVEFNDRFPPISDDEFLTPCGAGTNPEVALKVRKIPSVQIGVDYERIHPSTRFVEDFGAD